MPHSSSPPPVRGLAFYDFDGTLVSGNVVHQYFWYAWEARSLARIVKLVLAIPGFQRADKRSRQEFNHLFYAHYGGFSETWLRSVAKTIWKKRLPRTPLAERVARDRAQGLLPILITGSLDFAMEPVRLDLGFERVIANRLEFSGGVATGRLAGRLIAGDEKAYVVEELCREYHVKPDDCRAYADDLADVPMLSKVGHPVAARPKPDLRRVAEQRGWEIVDA